MPYEEETEYSTSHYRCIDPIENFKINFLDVGGISSTVSDRKFQCPLLLEMVQIANSVQPVEAGEDSNGGDSCAHKNTLDKIVLQPVKNFYIPLPQFDVEHPSAVGSPGQGEKHLQTEEYTFKWQEKTFSRNEIRKYSSKPDGKKSLSEKYNDCIKENLNNLKNCSSRVFSYVEVDNYSVSEKVLDMFHKKTNYTSSLTKKMNDLNIAGPSLKQYKNVPKRKIINYYPTQDFKNQAHIISKNVQKMFIMVDLGSKIKETNKSEEEEHEEAVLCSLTYNYSTSVLQVTPSFSKSKLKPYTVGTQSDNGRNHYYYWIYHASAAIKRENLTKEIQLMSKVFSYQEEVKKLQMDAEFFTGKPDQVYLTLLGEIISAEDFEYDSLHVHYFVKLPPGWSYSDVDSLIGRTQTCCRNEQGICYFSHLFEMNFCVDLDLYQDPTASPVELFFEVLSVDKYKRYRNEGYTYLSLPRNPGMHEHSLRCWRISDGSIRSELERFFIGGGPELEDVSYVGLSTGEKPEVMSRFGLKTIPSGLLEVKLNILHQSQNFAAKKGEQTELSRCVSGRLDAGSLLGSVNAVLEAFRRARERMLQAKKGLPANLNYIIPENHDSSKKSA